jgi:transcriptional regulator with GAF, ATPase, and Fis domain
MEQSAPRLTSLLRARFPVDVLIIRQLDPARCAAETIALDPALDVEGRSDCSPDQFGRLRDWCAAGIVSHASADALRARLPGLVPSGIEGDVLAGGVAPGADTLGAVLLVARGARTFSAASEGLLAQHLGPFAALLQSERYARELESLHEAAEADRRSLLSRLGRQDIADTVVGAQTGLKDVIERAELVARSDTPVLILGETGSGKEVVARLIHRRSRRASGPFLRVNCGAISPGLIDSELFGHERGSFTGAVAQRKGWFERADGGTLFLDEVGELPSAAQVRLLRVLQDGSLQRVGGQHQVSVDVRVVAATHRDLGAMVQAGAFRADLWYRIAVFPISLPPLRERPEDVPALATHFALQAAKRLGLAPQPPRPDDLALLARYPWPGNVRELASVMERAAILGDGRGLEVAKALGAAPDASVPVVPPRPASGETALDTLDRAMARHIEAALAQTHGRVDGPFGAARVLGINPHTLRSRMRKLGIDRRPFSRGQTP